MNFLAGLERETPGLLSAAYRWLLRSTSRSERVLAVLKTTVNVKALPRTRERNTEWSPQICDILCVLTCSGGAGSGQGGFKEKKNAVVEVVSLKCSQETAILPVPV